MNMKALPGVIDHLGILMIALFFRSSASLIQYVMFFPVQFSLLVNHDVFGLILIIIMIVNLLFAVGEVLSNNSQS